MNFAEKIFSEPLMKALGWTLIHSLWQAVLVALALALLLVLLRKFASTTRYLIATMAQLTVLCLAVVTFLGTYQPVPQTGNTGSGTWLEPAQQLIWVVGTPATAPAPQPAASGWLERLALFMDYFNQHIPLLVSAWMLGTALLMLRFMGSLAYLQRLRYYRVSPLEKAWQQKVWEIGEQMGVSKMVKVLESASVSVPMVIGHLKPVILMPIGSVTGLTPEQIEAVMAHEIAHIARNDYLVNLLQSLMDMVFFFNPAHWWISGVIRTERENCCDDMAVSFQQAPTTYARALTQMELIRAAHHYKPQPAMAMALFGKKQQLFKRVHRLINQRQANPSFREGFFTALVLMGSIALTSFLIDGGKREAVVHGNATEMIASVGNAGISSAAQDTSTKVEAATIGAGTAGNPSASATATASASATTIQKQQGTSAWDFNNNGEKSETQIQYNGDGYTISTVLSDGRYLFARLNEEKEIEALFVEGKKVPKRNYDRYRPVIDKVLLQQYTSEGDPTTSGRSTGYGRTGTTSPRSVAPNSGTFFRNGRTITFSPNASFVFPEVYGFSGNDSIREEMAKLRVAQQQLRREEAELRQKLLAERRKVLQEKAEQSRKFSRGFGKQYWFLVDSLRANIFHDSTFNRQILRLNFDGIQSLAGLDSLFDAHAFSEEVQAAIEEAFRLKNEAKEGRASVMESRLEAMEMAIEAKEMAIKAKEEALRAEMEALEQQMMGLQHYEAKMKPFVGMEALKILQEGALIEDGYLSSPEDLESFEMDIQRKLMKVNGKRVTPAQYERYLKIYEEHTGHQPSDDFTFKLIKSGKKKP